MSEQYGEDWTTELVPASIANLTKEQLAVRDYFVEEYLVDRNAKFAALRCGWSAEFISETVEKFMNDNYVQWKIAKETFKRKVTPEEEIDELEEIDRLVLEGLKYEAMYRGPGSSQAARVNALRALRERVEKEREAKGKQKSVNAGVMVVPAAPTNIDSWENQAVNLQEQLRLETLKDVNNAT